MVSRAMPLARPDRSNAVRWVLKEDVFLQAAARQRQVRMHSNVASPSEGPAGNVLSSFASSCLRLSGEPCRLRDVQQPTMDRNRRTDRYEAYGLASAQRTF